MDYEDGMKLQHSPARRRWSFPVLVLRSAEALRDSEPLHWFERTCVLGTGHPFLVRNYCRCNSWAQVRIFNVRIRKGQKLSEFLCTSIFSGKLLAKSFHVLWCSTWLNEYLEISFSIIKLELKPVEINFMYFLSLLYVKPHG